MLDFLKGKKTFLLTALAVVSAIVSFLAGQIDLATCIIAIYTAFGVGSLRADMLPSLSFLTKYRSYFVMAVGIIGAVLGYVTGGLSLIGMITAILAASGLGSFSAGIKKFIS